MMNDPRFNPDYNGPMIIQAVIKNPHNTPVTIISDEYKELNKKIIAPGERIDLALEIPEGYREFLYGDTILGKHVMYIGYRDEDSAEPFVYRSSN